MKKNVTFYLSSGQSISFVCDKVECEYFTESGKLCKYEIFGLTVETGFPIYMDVNSIIAIVQNPS